MFKIIDNFFAEIEGKIKNNVTPTPKNIGVIDKKKVTKAFNLGNPFHSIFVHGFEPKTLAGLDGWRDDKENFKIELLNEIKDFITGKWIKPWSAGNLIFDDNGRIINGFRNMKGRHYKNAVNTFVMRIKSNSNPYFITINDLQNKGGNVADKTKIIDVVSYVPIYNDQDENNKTKAGKLKPAYMLPKFHKAINIEFTDGIKKKEFKAVTFEKKELNEYVENFINELKRLKRLPKIVYDQTDRCYYSHSKIDYKNESIHLVNINQFNKIEEYYSTLFHEVTHSTKNPSRCGRGKLDISASLDYANEELVAEIGAMILSSELGLEYNRQNSLTYLKGWMSGVKGNVDKALLEAYAFAVDAVEYLIKDIDFKKLVPETMKNRAKGEKLEPIPTSNSDQTEIIVKNKKCVNSSGSKTKFKEKNADKVNKGPSPKEQKDEQLTLFGINDINERFNKDLKAYFNNKHFEQQFNLGKINQLKGVLLPNKEIFLRKSTLTKKVKKHNLTFEQLKDLPKNLNNPLMVFESLKNNDSFIFVVEKENHEGVISCVINLNQKINKIEVNEIISIGGRNIEQLIIWQEKNKLRYIETKKTKEYFSDSRFNSLQSKTFLSSIGTNINKPIEKAKKTPKILNGFIQIDKVKKGKKLLLNGEIGDFLGGYERLNYSIVLRGDKGAGKSRFLYQLMNAFADKKHKVGFLSLEMSPNSTISEAYRNEYINKKNLKRIEVSGESVNYDQLNALAKQFDVLAIDSWTKLEGLEQKDFDRLQKANPETMFLVIFQSTTGKVARGGNMPEYDASCVIQVNTGGIAVCEKNRFASTDKEFSVFNKCLIEEVEEVLK